MKRRLLVSLLVLSCLAVLPSARAWSRADGAAPMDPLLTSALALSAPGEQIVAIANLDAPASASELQALESAAGQVLAYPHLPMAAVIGTADQIRAVSRVGTVRSLYWNEQQELHTKDSQARIHAPEAWDLGYAGEGVGIAILDSGVDGTHPDLKDHLVANVKVLGPEYVQGKRGDFDDIILEDVATSDTTSGHGTHVAGDAAGDGTASGGKFKGPAYEADLIGIGAGEGLNIFTALAGFDWAIAHQAEHNIRVINNSWGTSFRLMDPQHPVLRAAKAAHDAGITVVFSAGNRYEEMTLSPYVAPWTITVAAGAKVGGLASFSSKGLEFDNLPIITDPAQTDFVGSNPPLDGVGLYHPAVTGIGEDVVSTRAPATVVSALGAGSGDETLAPGELPYYTHASGTSMSAPQVAGVAALAQQAFHEADGEGRWLTPDQVKAVVQLAAVPMDGLKLWQQGHGLVHAPRTVELAASLAGKATGDIDAELGSAMAARNAAAAAQVDGTILGSYAWRRPTLDSVQSLAKHTFAIDVPATADRVKAIVSFPPTTQANVASVDLYLFDAAGTQVGRAIASSVSSGVQVLDVRLAALAAPPVFGSWKLEARGDVSSNCFTGVPVPRCVNGGPTETWVSAQVLDNGVAPGVPTFQPTGSMRLYFHNDTAGVPAPPGAVKDGYRFDGDLVGGDLRTSAPDTPRAGFAGYAHTYAPGTGKPATFTSGPLASSVTLGRDIVLDLFLQNEANAVGTGSIGYWLYELQANGERKLISSEELKTPFQAGPQPVESHPRFALALPYTVAAGSRLQLELKLSAATSSPLRFYYDAPAEPAGLQLTTGVIE